MSVLNYFISGFYRASAALAVQIILATIGLSICPSVTHWHYVEMTQAKITKSSPRSLVLAVECSFRNSKGFTASVGVK